MIIKGSNYGDPREQAARETPHGLTPNTIEQLRDRFEQFLPGMSDTHGAASRQFFDGLLPEGAELSPMQKQANCPTGVTFPGFRGGGGGTMITPQRPYQPEFETCFEDTVVLMANGEYKQLKDIKVGDKVIDKNGLVQKVTHKRSMGVPDEMIEIKTWGGAIVYATDWHKWPVWAWPRTCACGCGEKINIGRPFKLNHYKKGLIDFKIVDGGKESYRQRRIPINYEPFQKLRSDELKKGDFLVIPRKFKELNPGISLLQARLLGYYLSEGSVSKDYLELTFGMHEIDTWVNDSSSILDTLDIINHLETNEKHNVARVRTKFGDKKDNLVKLSRWLIKNGGKSCYHKRMSGEVLRWPLKYKIEVLKGMFRGDGSQVYASSYKDGYLGEQFQVTYYTSSQDLARHINLILAQLGIFSRIQYIKPGTGKSKNGKKFKRNEGWRVITSNKSARKLSDLVWNTDTKYKSRKWKVRENCMLDDDYVYVPISSIKLVKNKDKKSVINITVSGDKSYLVNNNIGTYNSPDRQQYPVHRILANRYWRLFFKLDPVIGNCLDMMSTMPWSDFQLSGEGVTGEIKEAFETMCRETQVLRILEYMVKEFMVIGECVPHCWTPHQEVFTSSGFKRIDNIREGDLVLTHNNRFKQVTDIYTRDFDGDVLNFDINKISALPIQCTSEHPLYILTENGPDWIRAKDVNVGDYISVGIDKTEKDLIDIDITDVVPEYFDLQHENDKFSNKEYIKDIIPIDEDFMRLIGYYYAEGYTSITTRKGRVSFAFHINESKYHEDVINIIRDKFGVSPCITRYESRNTAIIHINSKIIAHFFNNLFGTGCRDKKIPFWLRLLPINKQRQFIIGLFRGDGNLYTNIKSNSTAQIQLAHRELVHLTWQMLLRIGVVASFNIFNRKRYGTYWKCSFNANNYAELATNIYEVEIEKRSPAHKRYKEVDGQLYFRIQSISEEEYSGCVWNLEVEDDHSYVVGGIVGHNCFFDDAKGIWTYIALHNPDQLEVIDAPFIKMEPIVEFIPDDRLRAVLTSSNHLLRQVREQMPPELISRLIARQNIPLSPINMTFIPRRMHPYDTRGTSIISRMWRILMYEDGIYNASIATARRHAGPLKVAKLGNPQTGWIPSQEHEKRLLQLLAQAELDVNAWLVYHYGIQFEMVGTTDRIMNISQHHEVIERIKLIAMGISKCFVHDTPINMADGTYKTIQNVKKGDIVIDKNGEEQEVTDSWCEGIPDKLIKINGLGQHKLTTTLNHKYPIYRNGEIVKLEARNIKIGDYFVIPRNFKEINDKNILPEMMRLLGYYISDGYVIKGKKLGGNSNGDGVSFTFGMHEADTWVKDLLKISKKLNLGFTAWPQEKRNSINIGTQKKSDVWIAQWLREHGGEYAPTKCLSKDIMQCSLDLKKELIKGLFRGDGNITVASSGSIRKNGTYRKQLRVKYTTVSHVLARQIQLILAQIGIHASIKFVDLSKHGISKLIQAHLHITGPNAYNMLDMVWNGKNIGIVRSVGSKNKFITTNDHLLVPITKIEILENNNIPVYNLSVSGSHSYLANNIASFNSFLHGEVTYASSITGLSVFLQRMKSVRNFFVNTWLIPKFFLPIARINGWIRRDKKEINFRYRVKRSQRELELENRWIVPKLEWEKRLDHNIDGELVAAMNTLEQMGIRFSKTTKYAAVGRKFEEELGKIKEEQQYERELNEYIPPEQLAGGPGAPGGAPGGLPPMPGGGPKPTGAPGGAPPSGLPTPGGGGATPNAPVGGGAAADKEGEGGGTGPSGKRDPATRETESVLWDHKGRYGNWSASEVTELCNLIREGYTNSPLWEDMDGPEFRRAVNSGDPWQLLEIIEEHLEAEGYPSSDARQLRKILDSEGVLKDIANGEIVRLKEIEASLGDGIGSINDKQAMDRLANMLDGQEPEVIRTSDPKSLMIGNGNEDRVWSGDISGILGD